ncbi:MAG: DUF302 domain-containing protein, partial [Thermodesulfobacteriota bacterium]
MKYYFNKIISVPFDEAITKVTEELKKEGFGILTNIDVQQTLKKKLDVDFRKYRILGAAQGGIAALGGAGNREGGGATGIEIAMSGALHADDVDKARPV